jgi:hypothetical protein
MPLDRNRRFRCRCGAAPAYTTHNPTITLTTHRWYFSVLTSEGKLPKRRRRKWRVDTGQQRAIPLALAAHLGWLYSDSVCPMAELPQTGATGFTPSSDIIHTGPEVFSGPIAFGQSQLAPGYLVRCESPSLTALDFA